MFEVRQTSAFGDWIDGLRDIRGAAKIDARISRLRAGAFGDVKSVGGGVSELRVNYGPGYRIYFVQTGRTIIILLCGGDKDSQIGDIRRAKAMAMQMKGET